ncbi:hypothetical protein D3C81_2272440 [compost metagenome]
MAAEEMAFRQTVAKLGDIHWHHIGFAARIHKGHFFVRFSVINIVNIGNDNPLVLHQINRQRFTVRTAS